MEYAEQFPPLTEGSPYTFRGKDSFTGEILTGRYAFDLVKSGSIGLGRNADRMRSGITAAGGECRLSRDQWKSGPGKRS